MIALLLCAVMMVGIIPANAYAIDLSMSDTALEAVPNTASSEVVSLREENVKHFDMGNGKFRAIAYSHPVHELDSEGNWQDIDFGLTLTKMQGANMYVNKASGTAFAANYASSQPLMTLSDNGNAVSMSMVTAPANNLARSSTNTVSAARVTNPNNSFRTIEDAKNATFSSKVLYEDVLPGVDLEYIVDPGSVKENIIVKEKASSYSYVFTLNLDGLYPVMQGCGSIILYDMETDTEAYLIPAPFMYDALGNMSEDVYYTLSESENTYTLTVTANTDWINAQDRSFPVTIDPTYLGITTEVEDTYITSDNPNSPRGLTTILFARSDRITYIKTPTPSIPDHASLEWAALGIHYYYYNTVSTGQVCVSAHQVTSPWEERTLTYNQAASLPNFGLSSTALDVKMTYGNVGATVDNPKLTAFVITDTVRDWINGVSPNYGIGLKYVEGSSTNLSVAFRSSESSYNYRPYIDYTYFVYSGAYFSALQNIYGFTARDATVIMDFYSRIFEKFPSFSIYEKAWLGSRLLGGLVYDDTSSLKGFLRMHVWRSVAGSIAHVGNYCIFQLDMTDSEFSLLEGIVKNQHEKATKNNKGDFAHMQIALAARLAYFLDLDGLLSDIAGIAAPISYFAGWLGDAVLSDNGTTSLKNDDYIADLDAENIYQQIILGKDIIWASDDYFSSLSTETRAEIFTGYIPYEEVENLVDRYLVDVDINNEIFEAVPDQSEEGETSQSELEEKYPDTYNFLCSLYNGLNEIGDY